MRENPSSMEKNNEALDLFMSKVLPKLKEFDSRNIEYTEFIFESDYILKCELGLLIEQKNFEAKKLANILSSFLKNSLSSRIKEIDSRLFLEYVYQYILSFSFPETITIELDSEQNKRAELFLIIYTQWLKIERKYNQDTFYNQKPLTFLTREEECGLNSNHEYFTFVDCYKKEYIYEMMKLNQEIKGYSTLDHISGVSYVAANIARQLKKSGLPIDIGNLVAAAIGHDIGKFGCRKNEEKRVPYLHYYYTNQWFKERNMVYIGNVAANHSTWDLELENLSAESLVLIYADFRVKNKNGKMHIYDIEESFQVILDKLDNVDENKEKRYRRVYSKLRDFENFMKENNIDTTLSELSQFGVAKKEINQKHDMSLIYGQEIVDNFKYQAIFYNINILNRFSSIGSFNKMLVNISGEKDWKRLREYLSTFEEYYVYTSQSQKLYIINILQELLIYKEEDVRNQAAKLMGLLIAQFDEEYRKEIPQDAKLGKNETNSEALFEKYFSWFIKKDHKLTSKHKEWLEINTKNMVSSVFKNGEEKSQQYFEIISKYYEEIITDENKISEETIATLLQLIKHIPLKKLKNYQILFKALEYFYNHPSKDIRLSVAKSMYVILKNSDKNSHDFKVLSKFIKKNTSESEDKVVDFIKYKLLMLINEKNEEISDENSDILMLNKIKKEDLSEIYLRNLKSATSWIEKKANVDLIIELTLNRKLENNLQTVMHFCNLLKVSSTESVRNHSGRAIEKIFYVLEKQEKNEVCIELIRALEMQDLQFTKYIPEYIGKLLIYQEPSEIDEIVDDFYLKIKTANVQVVWLILVAVGFAIESYISNGYTKDNDYNKYAKRLDKMLGILLVGLYSFDNYISHEALKIISKNIFSSKKLTLEQKHHVFKLIDKKILNVLTNYDDKETIYLRNAASLNSIYRFISDYEFFIGKIQEKEMRKIAFFPGTFDPFSLGHKEIAKAIRDLGYDVYLAVDEFSWSKKTQPNKVRRKIIKISIAEELNIYTFPEEIQINIANDQDLIKLTKAFGKDVSIVVGSDVVQNASSYKSEKAEILKYNHVIFHRSTTNENEKEKSVKTMLEKISGNVEVLSLAPQYEDISSTQIRDSIDEERDISELIDPLAQKYIYRFGLYKREPRYKTYVSKADLITEIIDDCSLEYIHELIDETITGINFVAEQKTEIVKKIGRNSHIRAIILRDEEDGDIKAFSIMTWLRSTEYYFEFEDQKISDYIRQKSIGRISYINGMWVEENSRINNLQQIILTETLAVALEKDYTYCIYKNLLPNLDKNYNKIFELQGFECVNGENQEKQIQCVNMTKPIVLNLDLRSMLKEPFRSNDKIKQEIYKTRENLQSALVKLYPGELVLSFDRSITYGKLIKKVCEINNVENKPSKPRQLGENMCVPFGAILNRALVPNTVTKSLHTEKVFSSDLSNFTIEEFPNYMNMQNQIKLLASFKRPVILIDDILHKGHRIKALDPLFRQEEITVKQIVVAVLSGQGKELMDIQNRSVEYIYFLPNLKNWFNENAVYPFMGGDYVSRGGKTEEFILPSVNLILPYASPTFIHDTKPQNIYHLSEVCLNNALSIFEVIEREYQIINERSFSLKKLGEVFQKSRRPDYGKNIECDLDFKPSEYLKNDLEKLKRIKNIIYR